MRATHEVLWTSSAEGDLATIVDFVAVDSPDDAQRILDRIRRATGRQSSFPHRGRVVSELMAVGVTSFREIVVSPWRVVYRPQEGTVVVFAVIDGRRDVQDLLLARLTR